MLEQKYMRKKLLVQKFIRKKLFVGKKFINAPLPQLKNDAPLISSSIQTWHPISIELRVHKIGCWANLFTGSKLHLHGGEHGRFALEYLQVVHVPLQQHLIISLHAFDTSGMVTQTAI